MTHFVFTPYSDGEMDRNAGFLVERLENKGRDVVHISGRRWWIGAKVLRDAGDRDTIYVLGHGNYGAGIGTHAAYVDENELADWLQDYGMRDREIKIKLLACWTGARTEDRRQGRMFSREAYGRRFARALRALGYRRPQVFGYVGSVAPQSFQLSHSRHKQVETEPNQNPPGRAQAARFQWNLAADDDPFPQFRFIILTDSFRRERSP